MYIGFDLSNALSDEEQAHGVRHLVPRPHRDQVAHPPQHIWIEYLDSGDIETWIIDLKILRHRHNQI